MESSQRKLPPNPKEKANPISKLFFLWTITIFKTGYKKVLDVGDLFQPLSCDKSQLLGDRLEAKWQNQLKAPGKPSLLKATIAAFWKEIVFLGLLSALNELVLRLMMPFLLGKLLKYFRVQSSGANETGDYYNKFISAIALTGVTAFWVVSSNHYGLTIFHTGMKLRVGICSLVYRKSLQLSTTALIHTSPGKLVNLLSNDVNRFELVCSFIHTVWIAPTTTFIIAGVLWADIGWAGVIGILVSLIVVPIQSYIGKLTAKLRYQTAKKTDERVRLTEEVVSGIQVIKMYAWEKPFSKLITLARQLELKVVKKSSYVRALYMTFNMFTTRAAMFCTMMTMALTNDEITAARIFVISSYFNVIAWTMSQMFVRGVAEIAEALVAFKRLQKFMEYSEKVEGPEKDFKEKFMNDFGKKEIKTSNKENGDLPLNSKVLVSLKDVTAHWETSEAKVNDKKNDVKMDKLGNIDIKQNGFEESYIPPTLSHVSVDFSKGQLIGIVGHVGAGKSSLLQVILEELPITSGSLRVSGRVSYAGQEPWVFGASVKQNILFGQEMERIRYDTVVKSCALLKDFEQFPDGDLTMIGEKGSSLSGGQKARISLARAVYRSADIYLLDDPLSAVDAHVGRHLFDEVIGPRGYLGRHKATRILVTHQVHFLKDADWVIILNEGKIDAQGCPKELAKSGVDFGKLLETEEEDEESLSRLPGSRSRTSSRSSLNSSRKQSVGSGGDEIVEEVEREAPEEPKTLEKSSKGAVNGSVFLGYLKSSKNSCLVITIFLMFLITQVAVSSADYWVSFWTSQEEKRAYYKDINETINEISADEIVHGDILNSTVGMNNTLGYIPTVLSTDLCMTIHGIIILSIFTIGILRSIAFYNNAMKASQNLHDGMFKGIISVPMRFFDTNPSGRILNRFSKDTGGVDELLPKVMLDACQIILNMVGNIIVTAIVQPIFLAPVAFLSCLFMGIRKVYLKTSTNIKRMEGITRSPVFTHLAATLSGLPTIRAFGAQEVLVKEFDAHQDLHSGSWYMFISTATAFGLSLDVICLLFMSFVTFYFIVLDKDASGDEVGLSITQSMALTGLLQWGIRQSAEIANQLMSVERMLEYCNLESEKQPEKPVAVAKAWISNGKIEFRKVSYKYHDKAEPVLKELTFVVAPSEKIGIVGRTGAGKSSLIGALFRLAIVEGDIIIDDVNTAEVPLSELRSRISIIPQDPVLFSGTLRRNLDPFEEFPDADLWQALEAVELKDIASGPQGLQTAVMAGGSNFSVGQRQLLCLGRAILRNNKILVLDEATANVDPYTDSLIQTTIRQRFSSCTVLTIAHRLHTIMDSDRILVMNLGEVEELDTPYALLQNPNGLFTGMIQTTGPQESEKLRELAKIKYDSVQKIS